MVVQCALRRTVHVCCSTRQAPVDAPACGDAGSVPVPVTPVPSLVVFSADASPPTAPGSPASLGAAEPAADQPPAPEEAGALTLGADEAAAAGACPAPAAMGGAAAIQQPEPPPPGRLTKGRCCPHATSRAAHAL